MRIFSRGPAGAATRAARRLARSATPRRALAAVLALCLALGQLLGTLPRPALAEGDARTVTLSTEYRHQLDGQEAYCVEADVAPPPVGDVMGSWSPGPAMLDYVLYHAEGGADVWWGWEPTRYAVWAIMHGTYYLTTYNSGEAMPDWFASQVQGIYYAAQDWADAGASGPERGCSRIYAPSSSAYQPLALCVPALCRIEVTKESLGTFPTGGNAAYSLAGAEFGVYRDEAMEDLVDTIVTDGDGRGTSTELAAGTYWVREDAAPAGHALDGGWVAVEAPAGGTAETAFADTPQSNPLGLVVAKVDSEAGEAPQGDATLAGAEFLVEWRPSGADGSDAASYSWVLRTDEDGRATLDEGHLASDDALVRDSSGAPTLPLGTVTVTELTAPEGYLLTDASPHVVEVTPEGTGESVATYVAPVVPDEVIRGGMSLQKRDLELDGSVPQGDASLDATYSVTNRSAGAVTVGGVAYAPGEVVWAGTADPGDGSLSTPSDLLPYGTYEVREAGPATGYLPDEGWSWTFSIREDGAVVACDEASANEDQVMRGGLDVAKQDRETLRFRPLGGATLEGAELTVYNASGRPVLVAGRTVGVGEACLTLATDADGLAFCAPDSLPYGTYVVRETKAPAGYLLNDAWSRTFEVRADGSVALLTSTGDAVPDQVIRGDLRLVKVDGADMGRLSGVPFAVTSRTTGESHVVVTDANGQIDTSSSWNPHTRRTNANDAAVADDGTVDEAALDPDAGVWFSGATDVATEPDDSLGALPFDTYEVRELRVAANEGHSLVTFAVAITRHGVTVDGGTVDDQPGPRIGTTLTAGDGSHEALASDNVTLTDAVAYENLEPGREYALTGTLVAAGTGEPVEGAGVEPVTSTTTFTPTATSGVALVDLTLDASALAGQDVVAFERLELDGEVVATHEDPDDEGQTVRFPEIGTTLTGAETGTHEALASGKVTLRDVVSLRNVTPGREYVVTGTLVDRETGEEILGADGKPVMSQRTVVPRTPSGSARVDFEFDASLLAGRTIVAFEELSRDGRTVAVHADLEDEAQWVTFPRIGTTATDAADGDKTLDATDGQEVVDTVSYEGLVTGEEYVLSARFVFADTSEPVTGGDGKAVTAEVALVPEEGSGTAEARLPLDGTGLEGRRLVVFETLTHGDHVVATHEDPSDEGQTVGLPRIGTTATDAADGDHEVTASTTAKVNDVVAFEGLVPGTRYVATGTLVDRATGRPLAGTDGREVKATAAFVPTAASGEVTVTFAFDASALVGHDLVAFEAVTRTSADGEDVTVATHRDPDDEGQTVSVKRPPTTTTTRRMPQTGVPATAAVAALLGLGLLTAGSATAALRRKDKDR